MPNPLQVISGWEIGQLAALVHKIGEPNARLLLQGSVSLTLVVPPVITIDRTKPFDPAEFIDKGWKIEEEDERSLVLTEVDLTKTLFETCLREGENRIQGEKKLARLKEAGHIRLDAKVFLTLWQNQHLIPESWKEKIGGNIRYIFFDGTILRRPDGYRYVLYLCWGEGEWRWYYCWLGHDWHAFVPSLVLAS